MNRLLALTLLFAAPILSNSFPDTRAERMVRQAIEKDAKTTYTCIREWTPWGSNDTVRVRRDQSSSGANKVLVLAPIQKQGFTIIDDCQQRVSYNPDKSELTIQDSPLKMAARSDSDRRHRLLIRNYTINEEAKQTVAGRKAACIKLAPKASKALFSRRYWIDESKSVLLRVEWTSPGGTKQVLSNTLSIQFPKSLPKDVFEKRFVGRPKEISVRAPAKQENLLALGKAVGFTPINPLGMPYGFLFIGADAITGASRTMAALRYTDGAANMTVYQVRTRSGRPPWRGQEDLVNVRVSDVWIAIDGDLPDEGMRSVVSAFQKSDRERETAWTSNAASVFEVEKALVSELRSDGLSFDQVATCLAASRGKASVARKAGLMVLDGKTTANLAAEFNVKLRDIERGVKRFTDRRG
ncbi:MAG: sigma-E factor regulatory protein RseB domain-containing protein [Fimbriimonadales bacterium]